MAIDEAVLTMGHRLLGRNCMTFRLMEFMGCNNNKYALHTEPLIETKHKSISEAMP
jgi:hypothetical protein